MINFLSPFSTARNRSDWLLLSFTAGTALVILDPYYPTRTDRPRRLFWDGAMAALVISAESGPGSISAQPRPVRTATCFCIA
jgi:hypothetical protein